MYSLVWDMCNVVLDHNHPPDALISKGIDYIGHPPGTFCLGYAAWEHLVTVNRMCVVCQSDYMNFKILSTWDFGS